MQTYVARVKRRGRRSGRALMIPYGLVKRYGAERFMVKLEEDRVVLVPLKQKDKVEGERDDE